MKREEIKKPDYTAGIRHTTVGSDRHDVRRENFRNKTVRTAKRRSGLIGRLFACSATLALALGACTDDAPVEQPKSGGVDLTCIVESDLTAALGSSTDDRHSWESGDRIGTDAQCRSLRHNERWHKLDRIPRQPRRNRRQAPCLFSLHERQFVQRCEKRGAVDRCRTVAVRSRRIRHREPANGLLSAKTRRRVPL